MDSAALIALAARQLAAGACDSPPASLVSRPPFQSFADPKAAQWYFAKLVADQLTPQLLPLSAAAPNSGDAWLALARLHSCLIGSFYSDKFVTSPDYRQVQQLAADAVQRLASDGSEDELRRYFASDAGKGGIDSAGLVALDSVDSPANTCSVLLVSQASAKNRGRRNEDRLLVSAFSDDLDAPSSTSSSSLGCSFLAVLDGHGGSDGADLAASSLLPHFLGSGHRQSSEEEARPTTTIAQRLRGAFLSADAGLREAVAKCGTSGGCTCTVSVISGANLTVAWVGDSEAWLIRRPGESPVQLTNPPHRPSDPGERARVEAAGGFVMDGNPPRLNGVLAVTRSLGDSGVIGVTAEPQVVERQLDLGSDVCLVIASDGLWDAVSPDDVSSTLNAMVDGCGTAATDSNAGDAADPRASAATALIDMAVANRSTDNTTVIVAWFV